MTDIITYIFVVEEMRYIIGMNYKYTNMNISGVYHVRQAVGKLIFAFVIY